MKVLVGLTGNLRGSVTYAVGQETARAMYGAMSGLAADEFHGLAQSAIGELANMISGRGTAILDGLGCSCDITPPMLIVGPNTTVSTAASMRDHARIDTGHGPIFIDVGVDT